MHILKKRGWDGCHLLYAQLGTGSRGDELLEYSRGLFETLNRIYSAQAAESVTLIRQAFAFINHKMLVVIDEASVALHLNFGTFKGTTQGKKNSDQPLLSQLYEVLKYTNSVLAGTNMSFGGVLSSAVSQLAEPNRSPPFNWFTSLTETSQMKSIASNYFGVGGGDMEDASILKGRCRFFMLAVLIWLTHSEMELFANAISMAAGDSLQDLHNENSPHKSVDRFIEKHKGNRGMLTRITDDLLMSFIQGQAGALVHEPNKTNMSTDKEIVNEVVDMSIAATAEGTYQLVLKEPVVVFGLIRALKDKGLWDPADTMIKKLCQNQNQNPSARGFMFEYVVACLLVPNFPL